MKSFNNFKIYNEEQNRVIDSNGFLYVKKSPILKSGILDYYGEELEKDVVDGVKIQPDKIYKVYIPKDELKKSLNSFKLKPIVEDHEWLGKDGSNAKGKQEGTTGENAYIDGEFKVVNEDIFKRGLCLPSDNKMTPDEQDRIIGLIRACFE